MLNLPTFLFINGPPGSGKDTLAGLIVKNCPSAYIEGFAEPIRAMIYSVFFPNEGPIEYNLDLRDGPTKKLPMPYPGVRRGEYNEPLEECPLFTIREEMIAFSEQYMKRRYGEAIFGKLLLARCKEQMMFSSNFVISDSGFVSEAQFIIDQVGAQNCVLIRLRREGYTYTGDSRGYIELPIRTINISNDDKPEFMLSELELTLGNL